MVHDPTPSVPFLLVLIPVIIKPRRLEIIKRSYRYNSRAFNQRSFFSQIPIKQIGVGGGRLDSNESFTRGQKLVKMRLFHAISIGGSALCAPNR